MVKFTCLTFVLALVSLSNTFVSGQNTTGSFEDIISNDADLSALYLALNQSGLNFSDSFVDPITVFAPNNDAFSTVTATLAKYTDKQYIAHLQSLLLMHIVRGETRSTDLVDGTTIVASNMGDINVSLSGGVVTLSTADSTATVTEADIEATGGVLHKIDGVLIPSFVATNLLDLAGNADNFSILSELLELTGLASTIGNNITATVFAPTNAAFNSLPEGGLDYFRSSVAKTTTLLLGHVITPKIIPTQNMVPGLLEDATPLKTTLNITVLEDPSGNLYIVDESTISEPNILAANGIIHGISKVLSVPGAEYPPVNKTAPTASAPTVGSPTAPSSVPPPSAPTSSAISFAYAGVAMSALFGFIFMA